MLLLICWCLGQELWPVSPFLCTETSGLPQLCGNWQLVSFQLLQPPGMPGLLSVLEREEVCKWVCWTSKTVLVLFGFQVEGSVKPAGEAPSESLIGERKRICWKQTWKRAFLHVLHFCLLSAIPVSLSFHCCGAPFFTCLVLTLLARSSKELLREDIPSLALAILPLFYVKG